MLTSKEKEKEAVWTKESLADLEIAFVLTRQGSDLEF